MRFADPRSWLLALLAAATLWLLACTGPGLEPPGGRGGDLAGPVATPEGPGAGVGTGGTGGGAQHDAGDAPPAVVPPDPDDQSMDRDGGAEDGGLDGGAADLDAGAD